MGKKKESAAWPKEGKRGRTSGATPPFSGRPEKKKKVRGRWSAVEAERGKEGESGGGWGTFWQGGVRRVERKKKRGSTRRKRAHRESNPAWSKKKENSPRSPGKEEKKKGGEFKTKKDRRQWCLEQIGKKGGKKSTFD